MAIANPTTNYAWVLPTVGGSADAWGTILNTIFGDTVTGIDAIVKAIRDDLTALQASAVDASNLTSGTLAIARIADASITSAKVASLLANKITAGAFAAGTYSFPGDLQLGASSDVVATYVASTSDPSGAHRDGTIWCKYTE